MSENLSLQSSLQARLDSAVKAARAAGAIIKNRFGGDFRVEFKKAKDPVTEVDRACEDKIRHILAQDHPEIAFWGEESGRTAPKESLTWLVDPLDGTKNFVHGYPFVAVSIALVHEGKILLGVVYDPLRDEMFTATLGGGTHLNGQPVTVSHAEKIQDALIATTMHNWPPQQGALIVRACQTCQGVRRGGAAALDLAQVAAGRLDAVLEWFLRPWDVAAAIILIEEAQGTVTNPQGEPYDLLDGCLLATNTNLHRAFIDFIAESGQ